MKNIIKLLLLSITCVTLIISCGGGGGGDPVQPETTETTETTETMEPEMVDNNPPPKDTESTEVCLVSFCDSVKNATQECYKEFPPQPIGANSCFSVGCAGEPAAEFCVDGVCDTSGTNFPSCSDGLIF